MIVVHHKLSGFAYFQLRVIVDCDCYSVTAYITLVWTDLGWKLQLGCCVEAYNSEVVILVFIMTLNGV